MDFQEILNHANYNTAETKYTENVKRYSSVLPPPKKVPKANVQSENIRKFLEKKKAEEAAKVAEAQRQKEKLLALRAQNTKSNKKAKIMASRTKDNDFSKIKLTDDEIEAKRKREEELIRKNLMDKVERMKARIEMEEKEKLMPKKRKRKSKNAEHVESLDDNCNEVHNEYKESNSDMKVSDSNPHHKGKVHKPKPPPPTMSFSELLKIAEKKQFEPLQIAVKKKEEDKLMTKKERKLMEEEIARQKRKQERLSQSEGGNSSKTSNSVVLTNKKNLSGKIESKKPCVIHVGRDVSKSGLETTNFKIPKSTCANMPINKNVPVKHKEADSNVNSKPNTSISPGKSMKNSLVNEQKKIHKFRDETSSSKDAEIRQKISVPKKNGLKINPVQSKPIKTSKFDEEALKASIEKEIREKIEKELEAKLIAKFAQLQNLNKASEKVSEVPKQIKKEPGVGNINAKRIIEKPAVDTKKEMERIIAMKKQAMQQRNLKPKLPEKKSFHTNPYLEPPRRLLEPQRPRLPVKRRIESDEDDDEDDMSDFIDDGPSQNEEDYSKYIKEIFGYDRNRYLDEDEDDVRESSFAEQMKEEVRSARLGYLEDLEEERLELQRKKKKKLK